MIQTTQAFHESIGKIIGLKLQKVVASVHIFGEETLSDVPLCVWLFFDNLPVVRLSGAPDGWGLQADETYPEPTDLEESGEIILRDVSRKSIFRIGLGRKVKAVWTIQSCPTGESFGLRFDFGQPIKPLILNWGDELYMGSTYPEDAQEAEVCEVPIVAE